MAYRFAGTTDSVEFSNAPINLAVMGAVTFACFLKRNTAAGIDLLIPIYDSAGTTNQVTFRFNGAALELVSAATVASASSYGSTSVWYLVAVTRAAGTVTPRFHVHDGTSWTHANGGGTSGNRTLPSGARLFVGNRAGGSSSPDADIVCAGIKKADSTDGQIETLSRTLFTGWQAFGFDWLIGFDSSLEAAGILQDQATPGTGDEIAITGTSAVSDPPGWLWVGSAATVTATAALDASATVAVSGVRVAATLTRTVSAVATSTISVSGLGFTPVEPVPSTTLWTFMLADIDTGDNLCDLTPASLTAKIAPRLNRPLTLTLELPADNPDIRALAPDGDPNLTVGTRSIKAYRDGVLRANVIVWNLSYDGDADTAKVSVTGYDPLVQLRRRPARDNTGDFSNPEFGDDVGAGPLVQGLVEDTIFWEGDLLIDPAGTCDASTPLGGNLADWPIMIFDLITIITDTGVVDVVLEPTEDTVGKLATLNAVDAWGTDRTATVNFDYATGDHNVATARRVVDMDDFCNKLWYYLGPKIDVQHWRGNITGRDDTSVAKYGVYMDIKIYDTGQENAERDLFAQLRATELAHRKDPQELLYVTPQAGVGPEPFADYSIGDLVTVNLGTVFGPTVSSGVQRVYGFDVDLDTDGVERVSELVVSAQGE